MISKLIESIMHRGKKKTWLCVPFNYNLEPGSLRCTPGSKVHSNNYNCRWIWLDRK